MGSGESKANQVVSVEADCLARASAASSRLQPVVAKIIALMQSSENHGISVQLAKLSHDIVEDGGQDGIVCKQNVSKGYSCRTCSSLENIGYCLACFIPEQHQGHNLIELESAFFCHCGDKELIANNCCRHGMPILASYPLFQSETSYLLEQLYHFRLRAQELNIQNSSLEAYHVALVQWLDKNASKGRQNQVQVAQALIRKDRKGVSGLRRLIQGQLTSNNAIHIMLEKVIAVMGMRDALLEVIYSHITNPTPISDQVRKGFYAKQNFHTYLQCPAAQQRYFSNPQHCRLALQNTPNLVERTELLLQAISVILKLPNAQKIFKNILKQLSLAEFCRLPQLGRTVLHLSALYLPVVIRTVKLMNNDEQGKNLLAVAAKQCFIAITKKEGERLPLERAFAVVVYTYFGKIPNLTELSQLLEFNLTESQCVSMVLDSLTLKKSYGPDYEKSLKHAKLNNHSILAADHIFVKIFCTCIENSKRLLLDQGWIGQFTQTLSKIVEEGNESVQVAQKRAVAINGLQSTSKLFVDLAEILGGEVAEAVLGGNSSRLLEGLLIIYQNDLASDFKQVTTQFNQNERELIQFIKTRATVDNKRIHFLPKEQVSPLFPYSSNYLTNLTASQQTRLLDHLPTPNSFTPFLADLQIAANSIWDSFAAFVDSNPTEAANLKDHILEAIKAILKLHFSTHITISASLLRFTKQITLPQDVQKALEKAGQSQTKKEIRNQDKKKAKMEALKMKQRHALQGLTKNVHQGLQCIICKNSKQGAAYNLGHFRYNNFFSKLLGSPRPFVQFNSCGHSIHEECLRESHNGQFRIWYPCVLCKSIANILMPVIADCQSADAQLDKVIDFLKNFGGTYTFLFEDRPELREFSVEDICSVFGLFLRSVTLQLALYPLLNPSYFSRSQFPTVRFLFRLLRISAQKLPQVDLSSKIEYSGQTLVALLYQYSSYRLQDLVIGQRHPEEDSVRSKLPSSAVSLLDEVFNKLGQDGDLSLHSPPLAEYRELVYTQLWQPPRDLFALQSSPKQCRACNKTKQIFETCLICSWTCCDECLQVRKVHISEQHQNEGIFINSNRGKYSYLHEQLQGSFGSLYADYMGEEPSGKAKVGQFELKQSIWERIMGDLLSNRLHSEIMKFY